MFLKISKHLSGTYHFEFFLKKLIDGKILMENMFSFFCPLPGIITQLHDRYNFYTCANQTRSLYLSSSFVVRTFLTKCNFHRLQSGVLWSTCNTKSRFLAQVCHQVRHCDEHLGWILDQGSCVAEMLCFVVPSSWMCTNNLVDCCGGPERPLLVVQRPRNLLLS